MATHTVKVISWTLALLAVASAAPRSPRSLEPPGYVPPCNCHNQDTVNETEYLPPLENSQSSGKAAIENEVSTERNLEYLPPLELGPEVLPIEEPQEIPENEGQAGGNLSDNLTRGNEGIQTPEEPTKDLEYLPPGDEQPAQVQNDGPVSVKLDEGNSQAEAVADGQNSRVTACVNGRCEEKQSRAEPEGYSYPKPAAPFELPKVEIARTVDAEIPKEAGCNTCGQQNKKRATREVVRTSATSIATASGPANAAATASASDAGSAVATAVATGPKSKREAARISSVSTDPAAGPVRISTLPFLVTKNNQQESSDYQNVRNRRDVKGQTLATKTGTAQTLPAKIGTAQTLPAKIGTAQTLPAKTGSAQTLPGRHRRDSKKSTYPSQKNDSPTAQTLPAKIGTAQTLPAKIGTAQTLPAKTGSAQTLPGRHRRDSKKSTYPSQKNDSPTAQTLPAKIGTAQTLPAKTGSAQTLPGRH